MRVKLRPDAHCTPTARGVYWSRADDAFVLAGPPTLYTVIDDQLDALLDGTSLDAMVAAIGDERARPVLEHVLRTLISKDILIDLDTAQGEIPDAETAREHPQLLAYLETHCAEPYLAFAAVRDARVAVIGSGPAADAARRGLAANGMTQDAENPTLAIVIDDCDDPVQLLDSPAALTAGTPVLPVVAAGETALIGPVYADVRELRGFQAVRERVIAWQRTGDEAAPARPVSAVLAGALAADSVLGHLAGVGDGRRSALVVYGHAMQTRSIVVPEFVEDSAWLAEQIEDALAATQADPASVEPSESTDTDTDTDLREVHRLAVGLTTRWTGTARWGRDLDLPQLPVSLTTLQSLTGPDAGQAHFLGWGADRSAAGLTAVLGALRHHVTTSASDDEGAIAAAGLTRAHWWADGLLRHTTPEALEAPATTLAWDDLASGSVRELWSLLEGYFDTPVILRTHTVPGLDWQTCVVAYAGSAETAAVEWGPSPLSAAYAALYAATARAQFAAAEKTAPQAPVSAANRLNGTWALEIAPYHQVHNCLRQLRERAQAAGAQPRAQRLLRDEAAGELSLVCGPVWLS